jgi:hypothetical protein
MPPVHADIAKVPERQQAPSRGRRAETRSAGDFRQRHLRRLAVERLDHVESASQRIDEIGIGLPDGLIKCGRAASARRS